MIRCLYLKVGLSEQACIRRSFFKLSILELSIGVEDRENYHIRAYSHPSNIQNLNSYRFVADSSQIILGRLIWSF
jgi:hypothetical protein